MTTTGTRLGRYEIRSKLGASGMGEVYLAEDTGLNRKVAIKFLRDDSVSDPQAKKRIVGEAQAAAAFDHPNICEIHEVGEEEGRTFIVMQYVEGETLAGRLKRQPLELREVLSVTAQVADGLAEAHSRGIIHRDIKPANIMLTARGQVKVMDFGKIFQQESSSAAAAVALARGTRRLPSRRLLVLISILALLAAAGGLFWWQSRPAAPPSIGSTPVDQLSRLRDQPGALVRWQTGSLCVEW